MTAHKCFEGIVFDSGLDGTQTAIDNFRNVSHTMFISMKRQYLRVSMSLRFDWGTDSLVIDL